MARLFIVGTPIGNLGDITFRAVETLKSVGLVAAEDTRQTLKLLSHLGIRKPLVSCRSGNEEAAAGRIIAALDSGEDAAYCSDAGTPGISDPGSRLGKAVLDKGHQLVPIPGPSALASLISVAARGEKTIIFEGFLSTKAGKRKTRLAELMALDAAIIIYESPFRILKLLADIAEIDSERYVCIGREMTKLHEEFVRGSVESVLQTFSERDSIKGEFSVYVGAGLTKN
ncbi:MAG: 16S rRNA (cytidine(1402)-2'-O)-methyltransferase [Spirochaetaceae bacterium]|jgi:16S rRNA (cytidine1402-2'-O)-methyltransferase|nr:16S rRNA (cytidine(1402)-2'-O)-methyltransferase [Spirochaetaceae bacterium]